MVFNKALVAVMMLLAFAGFGYCQLAHATASAQASSGFNTGYWTGGSLGSTQALAIANAQIYSQGCTPSIRNQIVQASASASASGRGQAFAQAFASASTVGPGLYYCYLGNTAEASAEATATWATKHGFNFNG